ncbi:hypothetical protein [Parahaliea aestuarii]|uniref:RHS repeat protein n=1 Tax=Parahaliea aestuarii TaxID=1852021 RepID=A0A5C9A550_9GAMM|nr:hypothetical protein [Parahaliea aestuarii]TXS94860.1 hypothetical protein FVW59_02850 [Parahaliea aestuarii]
MSLNFQQLPRVFAYGGGLRSVMEQLERPLMKLEVALAAQWQLEGTAPQDRGIRLSRQARVEYIAESDQSILATTRTERLHDSQGNLISTATYSGNGHLQRRTDYTYDAGGYRVSSEGDSNGDGLLDFRSSTTRDFSGNATSSLNHYGEALQSVDRTDTMFNHRGLQVRSEMDRGNDGSIDAFYLTQYGSNDLSVRSEADTDGDGVVDEVITRAYDAEDRLIRSTYQGAGFDLHRATAGRPPTLGYSAMDAFDPTSPYPETTAGFGVVGTQVEPGLRTTTFEWNSDDFLVRRSSDLDNDGQTDEVTTFSYDAGRLVAWSYDRAGDGQSESYASYTYNDQGHLIRVDQVDGRFGFPMEEQRQIAYDGAGRVARIVVSSNGSGVNDGEQLFSYDALGNVSDISFDSDGGGQPDTRSITTWEPSFRLDDWAPYRY